MTPHTTMFITRQSIRVI